MQIPAIGIGSPPQDIPRGASSKGATACRQLTDMNNKVERGKGESFVTTRMRQRSYHFCLLSSVNVACCMRLYPTNRVEGGSNPCKFFSICGDPDNVVMVQREVVHGTKIKRCDIGKTKWEDDAGLAGRGIMHYVHLK